MDILWRMYPFSHLKSRNLSVFDARYHELPCPDSGELQLKTHPEVI